MFLDVRATLQRVSKCSLTLGQTSKCMMLCGKYEVKEIIIQYLNSKQRSGSPAIHCMHFPYRQNQIVLKANPSRHLAPNNVFQQHRRVYSGL